MAATARNIIEFLLGVLDGLAASWLRSRRLAYRRRLRAASERGDVEFLRAESVRRQLTPADLRHLERCRHTPIESWPDEPADLIAPAQDEPAPSRG